MRNVVMDEILNPESSCPSICLTVSSAGALPDPPTGCEFAVVFVQGSEVGIFEWDGAAWNPAVAIGTADYTEVQIITTDAWTVTINGVAGLTSADSPYTIPAPTGYVDATFVNGDCSYEMDRLEPPVSLMSWVFYDINLLPFDPNDFNNWSSAVGVSGMTPTSVNVAGNSVDVYGYVNGEDGSIGDAGFTAFNTNILFVSDNAGFIIEVFDNTFSVCTGLAGVSFPACQIVGIGAFGSCTLFGGLGSAILVSIGQGAFSGSNMSEGTHLLCTSLGDQSFGGTAIASAIFPLVTNTGTATFDSCASLTNAQFVACLTIGAGAFAQCPLLDTVNFPVATSMAKDAFSCDLVPSGSLLSATFPEVITIGTEAFRNQALTTISIPKCTQFLETAGLAYTFRDCLDLVSLNAPLLVDMGTPTDNNVFENISGNTITITVAQVLQTIDGGNPDGDIVYLNANNTLTINYIP